MSAPEAWMDRARCTQTDPELWFPEKGGSGKVAKRICAKCAVRRECLAFALAQSGPIEGVWGGLTENERRKLRRQAAVAA